MRANPFSIVRRSAVVSAQEPDTSATSKAQGLASRTWGIIGILTLLYGVNVLALMRLDTGALYPYYLPDEAEYALVGQNLLTQHAFRFEGLFPTLIPPLYPLLVALGRLLSGNSLSTLPMSILNHLVIEAVIFPAYALARRLGISRALAILVAVAAAWVSGMWEASHYLAEIIYYPLFVTACVAIITYFQRPTQRRALLTGALLGLALLTKNTGAAPALAWALANIGMLVWSFTHNKPAVRSFIRSEAFRVYLLWPALSFGVTALVYVPWLLLRSASLRACVQCAGETNVFLQALEHPGVLLEFLPLFATDLFLSMGLLILPLATLGWRSLTRDSGATSAAKAQSLFIALIVVIILLMTTIYTGYTMGQLRERHLFALTPLLLILALRGVGRLRDQPVWKLIVGFGLVSLAQIGIFILAGYMSAVLTKSPWTFVVNMPWVYGLGFWATNSSGVSAPIGWDAHAFIISLIVLAIATQALWLIRPSARATVLVGAMLIMGIVTFIPVLAVLNAGELYNRTVPYGGSGALSQWLIARIGPNQTLAFVGCDPRSPCGTEPPAISTDAATYGYGDSYWDIYYAEAAGMYNMIPVPDLHALPSVEANNHPDYLLSPVALTGLPELGHFGIIRLYDLHAYRANPRAAPLVAISAAPGCYAESLRATSPPPTSAQSGVSFLVSVRVDNISACHWLATGTERILLAYRWRTPSGAIIGAFINPPAAFPHDLAPGQSAELPITIVAPAGAGPVVLELDLATFQGAGAFEEEGGTPLHLPMTITG